MSAYLSEKRCRVDLHRRIESLRRWGSMVAVDVDGVRRSWTAVETDWDTTDHRVRSLPEADLYKRVNDEWSYAETLRHLVFVTDAWIRRTVLSATDVYHRLGLPPDGDVDVRPWGIEVAARPTFEEVMTVRCRPLGDRQSRDCRSRAG